MTPDTPTAPTPSPERVDPTKIVADVVGAAWRLLDYTEGGDDEQPVVTREAWNELALAYEQLRPFGAGYPIEGYSLALAALARPDAAAGVADNDLREEVGYWRRDAAARMWSSQALMQAYRKQGRDDLAFANREALRAAVGASEEVQSKRWHAACELCGKPLLPGEAMCGGEDITCAHARCAVEGAEDDTGAPDPSDVEWRERTKDGRAALYADNEDPAASQPPAPEVAAEPVAYVVDCHAAEDGWRFRYWPANRRRDAEGCAKTFGVEATPLYTTPQPVAPASGDAVREALVDLTEAVEASLDLELRPAIRQRVARSRTALARTEPSPAPVGTGEIEGRNRSAGWLFQNLDTGTELSENHPVESGECDDAENIRPATIEALRDELLSAWRGLAKEQDARALDGNKHCDEVDDLRAKLAAAEARAQAAEGGADLLRQADAKLHDAIEVADGRLETMLDEVHGLVHRAAVRLANLDRAAERRDEGGAP